MAAMQELVFALIVCVVGFPAIGEDLGVLDAQRDIGKPGIAGSASFIASNHCYVVSGGGENMWFTNDAFHFVWRRVSGDFSLTASISWLEEGGNAHRKACLLVRQGLSAESAYVDVAVHGNGLTSLQFRESSGGMTREIQAAETRPSRLGIERQGDAFFMLAPGGQDSTIDPGKTTLASQASAPKPLEPAGAFVRLHFTEPIYVGIGVCAHDDARLERAAFSGLELNRTQTAPDEKAILHCSLETAPIGSKDRRVVYHTLDHIEAPNWSSDGTFLLFNSGGHIYRLPATGGTPEQIDTGSANRCNNDHGFSPDGGRLAISDQSKDGKSRIYIVPSFGGTPREVTPLGPSYWHGWSPDGSTLVYCAERDGEFDVYSIPADGGQEKRLTTAKGLDDGPDYTADGRFIYFNSERTGRMQIWRMRPDGSQQEQVTSDEYNNWFPHPSPDGRWLVFLSYEKDVSGHPANQDVTLRLMPLGGVPFRSWRGSSGARAPSMFLPGLPTAGKWLL